MRHWWVLQRELGHLNHAWRQQGERRFPHRLPGTSLESTFTETAQLTAHIPPPEGRCPKWISFNTVIYSQFGQNQKQFQWEAPNSDLDLRKKNGIAVLAVEPTTHGLGGDFLCLRDTAVGMLTLFHYQGLCTCIFITLVSYNTPGEDSWQNNGTYHC